MTVHASLFGAWICLTALLCTGMLCFYGA